uniref:UBX domain-containing protein n=2 Tax=Rhodosorus marinus TaxID=101924 RepID=A0A7S3A089_9RHOD|mmetsp:Transcript_38412/g.151688  ORF Transcript_38412/g.151688 Transcript_38412/m.151688 type:complete len:385 (+) Transcript_38412:209-1363(+)|eukprot:CAMPEP_0113961252 /NCGR_PEP_ID=MMETSP0011_2-20120614/5199_1 /TAXON_ID=101924 /ORGANISM="Rhodosorus marinus" /LENGTH=384 /DNA_ID=CAMNT_0000972859 /DNA_START=130 /DNA_END=1284 /DNA_ORIENTATION=+ /assembly_acc=CAM_ASM_000156
MDEKVASFMRLASSDPDVAQRYLEQANGDVNQALANFFDANGNDPGPGDLSGAGVGSSLNSQMNPPPTSVNTNAPVTKKAPPKKRTGIASLEDLHSSEKEEGQDYYAGGYNSGINVHDPNSPNPGAALPGNSGGGERNIVHSIINKGKKQMEQSEENDEPEVPAAPVFRGTGFRLGDGTNDVQQVVEDTTADGPAEVHYALTFWRDGFTVDDGPFRRYDDPANRQFLEEIERGSVPAELKSARPVTEYVLKLYDMKNEDYVPPEVKPQPFAGSGNRLGSTLAETEPSTAQLTNSTSTHNSPVEVDPSLPLASIQVRLADGTKLVVKLNHTNTVGDLRRHIEATQNLAGTSYDLSTTFPRNVLSDLSATVQDLKLDGAVVVVTKT